MINYESLIKESLQNDSIDNPCLSGIKNMGWNCYINSVLQVLASDIFLIESIVSYSKDDQDLINLIVKYDLRICNDNDITISKIKNMISTKKSTDGNELTKRELELLIYMDSHFFNIFAYITIKDMLINLFKNRNNTICPNTFIELIGFVTKGTPWHHLFIGRQNDPHEFLSYLQKILHETRYKKPTINFEAIYPKGDTVHDKIKKVYIDDFRMRCKDKYSVVNNIYEYYNLTVIKCAVCKHENLNASPYCTLSLPIPNDESISVFNCLNNLSLPEELDGYRCDKCKNDKGNFMEKKMITTPKVLILHLKRFESDMFGNLQKKNTIVDYPEHLNLNEYCFNSSGNHSNKFTLFGVICHFGNLNGGHYINYTRRIRHINDEHIYTPWYRCNDEVVNPVSQDEVVNNKLAYILLYHRV
jgi:ubiquitin carboxyl-terminal hydrolase 8